MIMICQAQVCIISIPNKQIILTNMSDIFFSWKFLKVLFQDIKFNLL